MKIKVAVINAFVDGGRGGNPAGVVLDADALSNDQKLAISKKVGLSETAFVSSSDSADFKLDFFTPQKQIAHCGHATIATFSYLSKLGLVPNADTSKETIDGIRSIQVDGDFAFMEQLAPKYSPLETDAGVILDALGISVEDTTTEPLIVNTGNSFLLMGVKDIQRLSSIKPNQKLIEGISEKYDLIGFYVFTQGTNVAGRDASTRMFAPRYGISEESATGMAAGPLACFLHDQVDLKQDRFTIEQGYSMQSASPSCIQVSLEVEDSAITSLLAGGVGAASRFEEVEI